MRIGIGDVLPHRSPEEWADEVVEMGFRAAAFPGNYKQPDALIDAYVKSAKERDILIAEVGVWDNPFSPDMQVAKRAREACVQQLRLADAIGARCCVNISGAFGPKWDFCYRENYTQEAYAKNVAFIQSLLDTVKPRRTCYTLESMQWMLPSSPEETLKIIQDIGSPHFKAHVDICNMVNDPYKFTHADELIDRTFSLLGNQIVSCHLKDITMEEKSTVHIMEVLPGLGQMDLPRYLQRISELDDPETPVLIEHLPDKASYEKALAHVKAIGAPWMSSKGRKDNAENR
ncbi:MAG: sugar phosphate isomerase/epimerase [Clostridia bacterium]|nr:sugar phosphate isomerase/epimerase [Clostridia bacterium]